MSDYTDVNWDLGEEDKVIPQGSQPLIVTNAEEKTSKGDPEEGKPSRRMVEVMVELDDPNADEDYAPIFHYLVLPNADEMDPSAPADVRRKAKIILQNTRRFLRAFGVKEQDFATQGAAAVMGARGNCLVKHEEYQGSINGKLNPPKIG